MVHRVGWADRRRRRRRWRVGFCRRRRRRVELRGCSDAGLGFRTVLLGHGALLLRAGG